MSYTRVSFCAKSTCTDTMLLGLLLFLLLGWRIQTAAICWCGVWLFDPDERDLRWRNRRSKLSLVDTCWLVVSRPWDLSQWRTTLEVASFTPLKSSISLSKMCTWLSTEETNCMRNETFQTRRKNSSSHDSTSKWQKNLCSPGKIWLRKQSFSNPLLWSQKPGVLSTWSLRNQFTGESRLEPHY